MDLEQLNTHISQLSKDVNNMDKYLLKMGAPHKDKPINHGLYKIRKSAIRVEFELDALEFRNNVEYKDSRKKLEKIKKDCVECRTSGKSAWMNDAKHRFSIKRAVRI